MYIGRYSTYVQYVSNSSVIIYTLIDNVINLFRKVKMKATAKVLLDSKAPEVVIEHKGVSVSFTISVFGKASFNPTDFDVFEYINAYWENLPEEAQDSIFEIYKKIDLGFDNTMMNQTELFDYLCTLCAELLTYHDLDLVKDFLSFKANIKIPNVFEQEYKHSIDNNTSREKTYLLNDYVKLLSLAVALKSMIPIWGEYINSIRTQVGNNFKEFYAFQLLNKSNIIHSLPMEKLKFYIEHIVADDKFDPNNSLNSISSEDFGYWLLSILCIKRLCIGDIRGLETKANLITLLYKFIIQRTNNDDANFENIVREKRTDDNSTDAENKISTLERYKIKTNISLGSIVELEYSMKDIVAVANRVTTQLDPNILARSLTTCQILNNSELLDPQTVLLRWVFKSVISPRGLMYLPKPTIVNALGALEAILWSQGYKYLAILATSHAVFSDREMVVSPVDSKMRVPEEYSERLSKIYPFTKNNLNKKTGPKVINLAAKSIDQLTDNLMMYSWKPSCSDEMLQEVFGTISRKTPIKPDIKLDLTKLVIDIGERNWS